MAAPIDTQYEDLLRRILEQGTPKQDRTGTGTVSLFGERLRYDLSERFPLVTTKKVHFKSIAVELLWFLRGDSNVGWLRENGVTIWDEWASPEGELGPVYGVQWRSWPTPGRRADRPDLRASWTRCASDPDSRRMIVSAWNVAALPDMALAPCHAFFQFYVADGRLSCQLYQRSADMFLGVPFNIASYALLTRMVADQVGLQPGDFVWVGGDCHIYSNHVAQVREQLSREVLPFPHAGAGAGAVAVRLHLRALHAARLPAPPGDPGSRGGVTSDGLGMIWAQARGGVIGADGALPWHLPEDLRAVPRADHGLDGRHGPAHLGVAARAVPPAARPHATSSSPPIRTWSAEGAHRGGRRWPRCSTQHGVGLGHRRRGGLRGVPAARRPAGGHRRRRAGRRRHLGARDRRRTGRRVSRTPDDGWSESTHRDSATR